MENKYNNKVLPLINPVAYNLEESDDEDNNSQCTGVPDL